MPWLDENPIPFAPPRQPLKNKNIKSILKRAPKLARWVKGARDSGYTEDEINTHVLRTQHNFEIFMARHDVAQKGSTDFAAEPKPALICDREHRAWAIGVGVGDTALMPTNTVVKTLDLCALSRNRAKQWPEHLQPARLEQLAEELQGFIAHHRRFLGITHANALSLWWPKGALGGLAQTGHSAQSKELRSLRQKHYQTPGLHWLPYLIVRTYDSVKEAEEAYGIMTQPLWRLDDVGARRAIKAYAKERGTSLYLAKAIHGLRRDEF